MKYTEEQKLIIESTEPNIVCLAVPGSGKTTTLVARLRNMVETSRINPHDIVVITYTVAAANELKHRLGDLEIGFVGTLHSFALRLLQNFATNIGFVQPLSLVDEETKAKLLKSEMEKVGWKGSTKEVEAALKEAITSGLPSDKLQGAELIALQWYQSMLNTGMIDFDGILYWTIWLLRSRDFAQRYHLLWDEGQDMAKADWLIFQLLNCRSRFLVGDPDQAIYGFRGGSPEFIVGATKMQGFTTYTMTGTRRCGQTIAAAANTLIAHNSDRFEKRIETGAHVGSCDLSHFKTFDDEVEWISKIATYSDSFAVLVRTNYLVEAYATALANLGVKIAKVTLPNYPTDWKLVKLALASMSNPSNDLIAAELGEGLGLMSAEQAKRKAALARQSVNQLLNLFPATVEPHCMMLHLSRWFPNSKSVEVIGKIMDGQTFETISDLLALINTIERESVQETAGVVVATMHSSKGREWDNVVLAGFVNEVIPGAKLPHEVEEERRLAYVAITRARQRLWISWNDSMTLNRFMKFAKEVHSSRFINEIDPAVALACRTP